MSRHAHRMQFAGTRLGGQTAAIRRRNAVQTSAILGSGVEEHLIRTLDNLVQSPARSDTANQLSLSLLIIPEPTQNLQIY